MKATYLEQAGKNSLKKITLEDGTIYEALPSETKEIFIKRISSVVDNFELTEDKPVTKGEKKAPAKKPAAKKTPEKKAPAKKPAAKKTAVQQAVVAKPVEGIEAVPAAEIEKKMTPVEEKPKTAPALFDEPRKVNRNPSLRDALESKLQGEIYVGKIVDLIPFRSEKIITGLVKQVVIDKRVNRAYLRVYDSNGKLYHTDVANNRYKVNEEETAKLEAAKAQQEKERFAYLRAREEAQNERKARMESARAKAKAARSAENKRKYAESQAAHREIAQAGKAIKRAMRHLMANAAQIEKLQKQADVIQLRILDRVNHASTLQDKHTKAVAAEKEVLEKYKNI